MNVVWSSALPRVAGRLLTATSFVVLAVTHLDWLGYGLAAVALALIAYQRLAAQRSQQSGELALLVTGLVANRSASGQVDWALAAAGLLLIAMILNEPELGRVLQHRKKVANLRLAATIRSPGRWPALNPAQVNTALVAAFGAGLAGGGPAWPFVALHALVCGGYGVAMLLALHRRSRTGEKRDPVRTALEKHAPAFVLYHSAPAGSDYQVTMWLPYLEQIGVPFFVLLRERHGFAVISAATKAPVVFCPSISAVDDVIVPSVRAAFYVNNGMKNSHCVRFAELNHIQLLHGDSDKPPSYSPVTGMYSKIFVAGQAAIDRYVKNGVRIAPEKFSIVGRPQVASIEVGSGHIWDLTDKVVLYAPTWIGHFTDTNYCSLPVGDRLIRQLLEHKATVILRAHPYTSKNAGSARQLSRLEEILAQDQARTGRHHMWGAAAETDISLVDCFNRSDAMVADVSSVVSDFLFSGKPFAITDMVGAGAAFVEQFPLAKAAYVLRLDMSNVAEVLTQLLETDPAEATRQSMRTYYLGPFPRGTYEDAFVEEARRYL